LYEATQIILLANGIELLVQWTPYQNFETVFKYNKTKKSTQSICGVQGFFEIQLLLLEKGVQLWHTPSHSSYCIKWHFTWNKNFKQKCSHRITTRMVNWNVKKQNLLFKTSTV